jgi:hypothetical protein
LRTGALLLRLLPELLELPEEERLGAGVLTLLELLLLLPKDLRTSLPMRVAFALRVLRLSKV